MEIMICSSCCRKKSHQAWDNYFPKYYEAKSFKNLRKIGEYGVGSGNRNLDFFLLEKKYMIVIKFRLLVKDGVDSGNASFEEISLKN